MRIRAVLFLLNTDFGLFARISRDLLNVMILCQSLNEALINCVFSKNQPGIWYNTSS